ncbi:MAG: thioredoxin [Marinilabiliales bacterium]|nr:thioredoxin [Marinilabiliales bacterium]
MQITLIILGIVTIGIIALYFVAKAKLKNVPLVEDHPKILTLTDKNFSQITRNRIILVDFWAAWCAPCRMMAPILNEMAGDLQGKGQVGKVDIEKYQALAAQFKVRSIPTMILLKNGKEVKRFVGIKTKDYLMKEMAQVQ